MTSPGPIRSRDWMNFNERSGSSSLVSLIMINDENLWFYSIWIGGAPITCINP